MSYDKHASSYETINGTALPYSNPSLNTPWSYANLESLALRCTKNGTIEVRLSYLALEVTYTPTAAADNATFFGANF